MTAETTRAEREELTPTPDSVKSGGQTAKTSPKAEQTVGAPVKETAFSEVNPEDVGASDQRNLDFLLDIPLEVTVELGRTRMLIADLLRLGEGSVVELTKAAGEHLDILVNRKLMARGEVVVVNDKFGIRLTDIISPAERVRRLG